MNIGQIEAERAMVELVNRQLGCYTRGSVGRVAQR